MLKKLLSLTFVIGFSGLLGCSSQQLGKNQFVIDKKWARSTLDHEYLAARRVHRFAPILTDKLVIVANSIDGIVAYGRKSARVKWRIDLQDGVEAGATLVDGILYFGSGDGQFYAVNSEDGKTLWTYPIKAEGLAKPLVSGTAVYVLGGNNVLHSLNAKTGKLNWVYSRREASNLSIRGGSQSAVDGDSLYVGFSDGAFLALNKNSGNVLWELTLNKNNRFKDVDSAPIIDGSYIYVSGYDGSLYCLQKSDGKVVWTVDEGGFDEVLISGNTLYYSATSGKLLALDKLTGRILWKKNLNSLGTGPVAYKGTVVVGETSGALKFFDARTGDFISMFEPGRGVTSKASVDPIKGEVYFMSIDANVYALNVQWKRFAKDWPWE